MNRPQGSPFNQPSLKCDFLSLGSFNKNDKLKFYLKPFKGKKYELSKLICLTCFMMSK